MRIRYLFSVVVFILYIDVFKSSIMYCSTSGCLQSSTEYKLYIIDMCFMSDLSVTTTST